MYSSPSFEEKVGKILWIIFIIIVVIGTAMVLRIG